MDNKPNDSRADNLPPNATEFIRQVVREMGYHKKARQEVKAELTAHFEDELRDCADAQEREQKVRRVMEGFGNARLLAVLCRRAKKRCRPLWASALVRTAQGAGVLLILFLLYTAWFVTGRPAPTVDYVALLNQIGRPQIAERDNAWPSYEKAFGLLVKPGDELRQMDAFAKRNRPEYPGFAGLPEEARQAITQWVQKNEAAWQEFLAASAKSYFQRPYACDPNLREPSMMCVLLPSLPEIRTVATVGIWRARIELQHGEVQQALDDCLAVARAAAHWQPRGMLIEQLVGLGLSHMAHEEIVGIVHERDLPPAGLADLQRSMADLYPVRYPSIDLEGERLSLLDTIQRVFTDRGPGGGHLAPSAARSLAVMGGNEEFLEEATGPLLMALSMIHAGREATTAKVRWIFDQQAKCANLSPYERYAGKIGADRILNSLPKYRYALVHMLAPALDRVADLAFQSKALHEATLAILAVQRYRAEKGSYPASLSELKQAGYLDALPADPYHDGPLVYKVAGDKFTLYSFGPDFQDNGGQPGTDRKGRPQRWPNSGDAVFWPVP